MTEATRERLLMENVKLTTIKMISSAKTRLIVTAKLLTNPSVASVANATITIARTSKRLNASSLERTLLPTGTLLHLLFVVYVAKLVTPWRTATEIPKALPLLPSGKQKCNRRTFLPATATPISTVTNPTPTITKLTTSSPMRTMTKTMMST